MIRFLRLIFGGFPPDAPPIPPPAPTLTEVQNTGPLHAHELTPDDAAIMQMFSGAGCTFGGDVTLPSGRTVTGEEMHRWVDPAPTSEETT